MSDIAINPVTRRVQFTGNTGTGPYAFNFNVLQSSDIVVYKNNVLLTETTDYTVSIAANGTGNITMVVALVLTDILTIIGGRELSRTTDFVTAGDLLASSLNEQLDSNVIMSQQLDERFGRTLAVPPGDEDKTLDLPLAADRADKIILFDESGNVTAAAPSDFFGNAVLGGNFIVNTATGNGSQTAFGLTVAPGIKTNIQIHIDGVYQNKSTFTLSGSTVTFTEAPPLNAAIEFMMGESVTTITGDASAITYNQGGTGAQDRTLTSKLQDTVSVKDFGAVGDGTTNDAAAVQAAIDYVQGTTSARGEVFFPAGDYRLSSGVTVSKSGVSLRGDGYGGTNIKVDGGVTAFTFDGGVSETQENVCSGFRFTDSGSGSGTQTAIHIDGLSRKIYIRDNVINGMDYGVLINDSYTVWIEGNNIFDNDYNISCYRTTAAGNVAATTIYIGNNSLMHQSNSFTRNISMGESGQPNYNAGAEQGATLIVYNNAMDGGTNWVQATVNVHWMHNHAEQNRYGTQPFVYVDSTVTGFLFAYHHNYLTNYDYGVQLNAANFRSVSFVGNYFRNITYTAIKIPNYQSDSTVVLDNFYSSVGYPTEYSVTTSNYEYGENVYQLGDEKQLTLNGMQINSAASVPTSGRWRHGDVVFVHDPVNVADPAAYMFKAGGSNTTKLSHTNFGASSTTGSTTASSDFVTPADISLFRAGDRLVINGAGGSGANLSCAIRFIDYSAGTFQVIPTPSTTTSGTTISFEGASSSEFTAIAGFGAPLRTEALSATTSFLAKGPNGHGVTASRGLSVTAGGGTSTIGEMTVGMLLVHGDDGTNEFADVVLFLDGATPSSLHSLTVGSPGARTYSRSGSNLAIAVAGSGTYNVHTTNLRVG